MANNFHLDVAKLDSKILAKINTEIGRGIGGTVAKFDTHIKGVCDIHGKGDHIKGAGPNYLKDSTRFDPSEIQDVLKNYGSLVDRLAIDVAAKLKTKIGG